MTMRSIVNVKTAWDWIGFYGKGGTLRTWPLGRTLYEQADYSDARAGGRCVRLGRLEAGSGYLRPVYRYVHANQLLEFIPDEDPT